MQADRFCETPNAPLALLRNLEALGRLAQAFPRKDALGRSGTQVREMASDQEEARGQVSLSSKYLGADRTPEGRTHPVPQGTVYKADLMLSPLCFFSYFSLAPGPVCSNLAF